MRTFLHGRNSIVPTHDLNKLKGVRERKIFRVEPASLESPAGITFSV